VKFERENRRSILCVTGHYSIYTQSKYLMKRQTETGDSPLYLKEGVPSLNNVRFAH
jgi:hypothetical protein